MSGRFNLVISAKGSGKSHLFGVLSERMSEMVKENKFNIWFRNNFEMVFIILFTLVMSIILFIYRTEYLSFYTKSNINESLIGLFGSLLGLLLTAYAILFGLIPTLPKNILEAGHFLRINRYFFVSTISVFVSLILGLFLSLSTTSQIQEIVRVIQFFFSVLALLFVLILTIVLFLLFKIARDNALKPRNA